MTVAMLERGIELSLLFSAAVVLGGPYRAVASHLEQRQRPRRRRPRWRPGGATVGPPHARTCDRENARARVSARANPRLCCADGPVFGRRFQDRFTRVVTRSRRARLGRELDRTKSFAFYYLCGLGAFMPGRLIPESIRKQAKCQRKSPHNVNRN